MSLAKFTEAVGNAFYGDALRAGVVVSKLGYRSWYVSVCRYPKPEGARLVVCSAKGETFAQALTGCTLAWLVHRQKVGELSKLLQTEGLERACTRAL